MRNSALAAMVILAVCGSAGQQSADPGAGLTMWYDHPAAKWESALPVGNGRLGAMVFGKTDVERIQFNEDTYWSGGPYSQTVKGGARYLAEVQRLVFERRYKEAHLLFGRHLMGYPVEQQKYQSMGDLVLTLAGKGEAKDYRFELDLDSALVKVGYEQGGVRYAREVFSSAVDQAIVVRLSASEPISIAGQMRVWKGILSLPMK